MALLRSMLVSSSGYNALCAVRAASSPPEARVEVRGPGCSTFLHEDDKGESFLLRMCAQPYKLKSCRDEMPLSVCQMPSDALLQAYAHLHCAWDCKPDCNFLGFITIIALF